MPLYEFRCKQCKSEFELLVQTEKDISSLECPECGGRRVEKRFSVFGVKSGSGTRTSTCSSCPTRNCAQCPERTRQEELR